MMIMAVLSLHQEGIEERSRSGASMEEITDHPVSSTGAVVEAGVAAASSSPAVEAPMAVSPRPPPASPAARYQEEEEDEGDVCRICRIPGDAENPLRYPCACSGSIKFVHQDCLLQWLNHSNARQCEVMVTLTNYQRERSIANIQQYTVCKHAFSFSPVYAENAPARLPFQEFVVGMAMKACHVLQFFVRLAFVLSVWLLIIPFITFWIWRLTFVRSLGEAQRLFLSHISAPLILTDCLHGFLLSASIVFIFLGATSLRDYFRHIRDKVKECKYAACKEIVRHAQNFQESNSLANLKHHVRVPEYSFDDTVIVNHDHNSEDEAALETTTSSDGSDIDENVCCKGEEESGTDG